MSPLTSVTQRVAGQGPAGVLCLGLQAPHHQGNTKAFYLVGTETYSLLKENSLNVISV